MTHLDTVCSKYGDTVLPDEDGKCSLCGAVIMSRHDMVERLVGSDITDIQQELSNGEQYFIDNILRGGWKGYSTMTESELVTEYRERDFPEELL